LQSWLIENATVVTMDDERRILPNADLGIEGACISGIWPTGQAPPAASRQTLDATGMVVLPGLINAHTHCAMTLLRGYADDMPLMPWLEKRIWPFEAKLRDEDVYWGTLLASPK